MYNTAASSILANCRSEYLSAVTCSSAVSMKPPPSESKNWKTRVATSSLRFGFCWKRRRKLIIVVHAQPPIATESSPQSSPDVIFGGVVLILATLIRDSQLHSQRENYNWCGARGASCHLALYTSQLPLDELSTCPHCALTAHLGPNVASIPAAPALESRSGDPVNGEQLPQRDTADRHARPSLAWISANTGVHHASSHEPSRARCQRADGCTASSRRRGRRRWRGADSGGAVSYQHHESRGS